MKSSKMVSTTTLRGFVWGQSLSGPRPTNEELGAGYGFGPLSHAYTRVRFSWFRSRHEQRGSYATRIEPQKLALSSEGSRLYPEISLCGEHE
jgi:hypothetical protein